MVARSSNTDHLIFPNSRGGGLTKVGKIPDNSGLFLLEGFPKQGFVYTEVELLEPWILFLIINNMIYMLMVMSLWAHSSVGKFKLDVVEYF